MAISGRYRYKRRMNKRPRKMKKMIPKVTPKLKSAIKSVVRQTLEPQSATTTTSISNVLHRNFYYTTPISTISQSVSESGRTASQVYVKGIRLKFMLNRKSTFFDDIRLRVFAFYEPLNEADWTELISIGWTGATTSMQDAVFLNEGSGLETINKDFIGLKTIFDKNLIFKSNNYGSVASTVTKSAKPTSIYIPLNRNVKFRTPAGSSTVPHRQIFLCMYAYGGGLVLTDLNSLFDISTLYTVYYRDV